MKNIFSDSPKWAFFALIITIFSCETAPKTVETNPLKTPENTTTTLARTSGNNTFRGIIQLADESRTMIDCGSGKTYWLEDASSSLVKKMTAATEPVHFENEPAFAVLTGKLLGKSKSGHAASYENVLSIEKIDSLNGVSIKNLCVAVNFTAGGNEPFWHLVISEGLQMIYLQDIGGEKAHVFPWTLPEKQKNDSWLCLSENAAGERIRILIKKEKIADDMSGEIQDYSALVVIGNKKFKGTANKQ